MEDMCVWGDDFCLLNQVRVRRSEEGCKSKATALHQGDGMPSYKLNRDDFLLEDFDGDFVLLNARSGVYFEVADRAADLLRCLLDGACPVKTVQALEVVRPDAAEQARAVFTRLIEASVLRIADHSTEVPGPSETDVAALAAGGSFVFEGFDDMTDLILADPVHDIDLETGRLLWADNAA